MTPPPNTLPPRRKSTNTTKEDDAGLSQSLSQLSLSREQRVPQSPNLSVPSTPLNPPSRHASPSPRRAPSRSPSGRDSRAGTPPLIRKASMNSLHSANGIAPGRSVSRRSSLGQILSPTARASFGVPAEPEPPMTANSVASGYFKDELEAHHGPVSTLKTDTVVILNDAVYGHRFSRPRTSRSALSTIVERPERIKASVLGVSTAYVRLGERYTDGAFPVLPKKNMQTLQSIPFRIHKTVRRLSLSSPAVTNVHGTKWMEELKIMCDAAESILARGGKELQRPAMSRGADHASAERLHEGDLYLCAESLDAIEGALGAVCEGVDTVFSAGPRRAFVAVRPPGHHCSASHPSGFCWVNNVHVGIMHGILNHGLTHAAIIDFDLHHGDGSQAITWAHNSRSVSAAKNHAAWKKTSIGYFSLHDINSYPCEMGDEDKVKNASLCIENAHGQTAWNVHLQPWKTEEDFWEVYETKYLVLLDKTRAYLKNQAEKLKEAGQTPRAVIFLSAGFDASEWESAGMQRHQVNVPTEFYARLTQDVVRLAAEEGLYVEGRVVSVLEGGYSDRALMSGIFSHISGLVSKQPLKRHSISSRSDDGVVEHDSEPAKPYSASTHSYDSSWWAGLQLDQLEAAMSIPDSPPKKPRTITPPTYSSPTQASTARAVDPLRMKRSMSGLATYKSNVPSRSPTPPPPDVSWMVATHELSKLLIPKDRQTDSCTHEDLNAEATRIRRDRQSFQEPVAAAGADRPTSRMSLRERRTKAIDAIREESGSRQAKDRRKTVATSVVSTDKVGMAFVSSPAPSVAEKRMQAIRGTGSQPLAGQPPRRASRRLSGPIIPSENGVPGVPVNEEGPARPATSAGAFGGRPASSMSSRTLSSGSGKGAVRKPRPSVPRRETAPKTPHGKAAILEPVSAPATARAETPSDDMDKITKGMKKIKINLITQSQKEAREKARLEADRAAVQTTRRPVGADRAVTSPVLKSPISAGGSGASLSAASQALSPDVNLPSLTGTSESGLSTPVLGQYTPRTISPEIRQNVPNVGSPRLPNVAVQPMEDTVDYFVPYQPEGPAPVAISPQEPLKWLPPNLPPSSANTPAVTPSPVKKNTNLFQYGGSGIPFAPRPPSRRQNDRTTPPKQKLERVTSGSWPVVRSPTKK